MWFESIGGLGRVALSATASYLWLILVLRLAGKRSLSKLNAFDFAVTVAFGSLLASVIISKDVPLAEGVVALATLALLQFIISRLSIALPFLSGVIRSSPTMLFSNGHFLDDAMYRERVTRAEVEEAIRKQGYGQLQKVGAVVLETDGNFSVIAASDCPSDLLRGISEHQSSAWGRGKTGG